MPRPEVLQRRPPTLRARPVQLWLRPGLLVRRPDWAPAPPDLRAALVGARWGLEAGKHVPSLRARARRRRKPAAGTPGAGPQG